MMPCAKAIVSPSTSSVCGPVKRPVPSTTRTSRCLAIPARPPVSRPTAPSLNARTPSRSISGAPKRMPWVAASSLSAITRATCSSAFTEGMQPTLRHTPPSLA